MKRTSKQPVFRHYRALFESGSFCGRSDGELLARFLTRDGESAELAFAVLVERHSSSVLRICKAIAGNESDAEDAFQATFFVLANKAGGLTVRETLGPWLHSVARRISRRTRARSLARAARELRAATMAVARQTSVSDSQDDASVLHEEIDRLPERYRLPLLLCDLDCQSHQEAARTLGWPLGTVKSRQARARQRLRSSLSRRGFSAALPFGFGVKATRSFVPDSLIQATARAAARSVSRGTAAEAVSASVSSLVTNTLRAMIMTRVSILAGVLLTLSAGVAATVVAQTYADPTKPGGNPAAAQHAEPTATASHASVFEYEIRIWKDGAPVTPTMKLRAHAGETTQLKIPEGTVDLSFRPKTESAETVQALHQRLTPLIGTLGHDNAALLQALTRVHGEDTVKHKQAADQLHRALDAHARANSLAKPLADPLANPLADQVHEQLLGQAIKSVTPGKKDHESRLDEIERKLEQILKALDSVPQKDPGTKPSAARP